MKTFSNENKGNGFGYLILVAFVLFFFDTLTLTLMLLSPQVWLLQFVFFFFHFLLFGLLLLVIKNAFHLIENMSLFWLLAILFLFFGPAGALVLLIACPLSIVFKKRVYTLEELIASFFPSVTPLSSTALYERIIYGMENLQKDPHLTPFRDILLFGSNRQKSLILSKILRFSNVDFIDNLRIGLQDPNNSIRVQAGTAMMMLSQKYFNQSLELQEKIAKEPDNITYQLDYATFCLDYASAKFLDPELNQMNCERAICYVEAIHQKIPEQVDVIKVLIKLYLSIGQPQRAVAVVEKVPMSHKTEEIFELQVRALYEIKEYMKVKALVQSYMIDKSTAPEWITIWSNQ